MGAVKAILGTKLGMTQIFEDTRAIPVTIVQAGPCHVAQVKTEATDGYDAIQLAFVEPRPGALPKPMAGHFAKHGGQPGRHVVELRTDDAGGYAPGQAVTVDVFPAGSVVDVVGVSRGKGFAGVMKRHGFGGLSASHGTERKHRSPGSVGACATPSRTFRGMRMAGHMGNERVTILNLDVVQSDPVRNLLLIRGAIPGPQGGLVMIRSAVKAAAGKGA